jgi:hypothetical protein
MDCFVASLLATTARYIFAFPRRDAPELLLNLSPRDRGSGATPSGERGMPGARCTRSRACRVVSTRVSHHGRTGTPGIPARNGFNGFLRALLGDRALLPPSPPRSFASQELDASVGASGPHDFAVRKIALSSVAPPASIASQPYVRDDRETPLVCGPGWREVVK